MVNENILSDIKILINNIPDDATTIEKLRWIYMKLGNLFSYNYEVAENPSLLDDKVSLNEPINRYQTCIQIASIFNDIVNEYIDGASSSILPRPELNVRGTTGNNHVGNIITLDSGEKYIMDLSIDLFYIQSGLRTTQFGYTQTQSFEEDIIPAVDLDKIDLKYDLVQYNHYLDDVLEKLKKDVKSFENSDMYTKDKMTLKVSLIKQILPKFRGYHEGKQFISYMIYQLLGNNEWHEYNLIFNDDKFKLKTVFSINQDNETFFYIYSPSVGLIETNKNKIKDMIENQGFNTKSEKLLDLIYSNEKGIIK